MRSKDFGHNAPDAKPEPPAAPPSSRVIEVRSEEERRQHQRRREDQVRTLEQAADLMARERKWNLLRAAARIYASKTVGSAYDAADRAIAMLDRIEECERERHGKDETK